MISFRYELSAHNLVTLQCYYHILMYRVCLMSRRISRKDFSQRSQKAFANCLSINLVNIKRQATGTDKQIE